MQFLRRKKAVISKGDLCVVKTAGIQNLPPIVVENNEVMYIGEFKKESDTVAICSSVFATELLFIQKNLLEKSKKQPSLFERMLLIQMDTLVALKEISFHLKGEINYEQEPHLTNSFEEDTKFN